MFTLAPERASIPDLVSGCPIGWEKLLEAGSLVEAKSKGWLCSEGKEYEVAEGDVMEFLFNV